MSFREQFLSKTTNQVLSLLDEQGPRLYALLVRITLREDVAEDLMQELFLRLSRRDALLRWRPGWLRHSHGDTIGVRLAEERATTDRCDDTPDWVVL